MKQTVNKDIKGLGVGFLLAIVLAWVLSEFAGVQMPVEISTALGGIFTAASHFIKRQWLDND